MNKVLNINLGSAPFVIDDNAYEALARYIDGLRTHFANSEGCDEIIADIESRIAELLNDYLKERQIVTLADVKRAISVMGIPTDIDNNTNSANENSSTFGGSQKEWSAGKRLFRNEDDKVISGVCSGLSAYLGLQDPLWMRLIWAALLFFTGGSIAAIYILLLFIIPKATTAADKLAMRGENVNVDNIAKTVQDEVGNIGQRINNFGQDISNGFNGKKEDRAGNLNTARAGSVSNSSDTLANLLKLFVKIILLCLLGVALIALIGSWIGFLVAAVHIHPYMPYFMNSTTAGYAGLLALMVALVIPIIALVLALIRIFYKNTRIKGVGVWGLSLVWLGSLLTLIVVGTTFARQFTTHDSTTRAINLNAPNAEVLNLAFSNTDENDEVNLDVWFGDMFLRGDRLMSKNIDLDVEQSPDAQFHLVQKNSARGASAIEARRSADEIEYNIAQTDSTITFAPLLTLPKGAKCKWQKVKLTLQVPIGKKIKIMNTNTEKYGGFGKFTNDVFLAKTNGDDDWERSPEHIFDNEIRTWTMTQNGLVCADCTPDEIEGFSLSTDAGTENNDADTDTDSSTTISGDNANISINEKGLRIKARDNKDIIEVKVDKNGVSVKKNGTEMPNQDVFQGD